MRIVREFLALAGLLFQIGAVWFFWTQMPAQVPTHFGFNGTPDAFGAKSSLLVLPVVTLALYGLLSVLSFFPQAFNYPVEVTAGNRERLQGIALGLLGWLKAG